MCGLYLVVNSLLQYSFLQPTNTGWDAFSSSIIASNLFSCLWQHHLQHSSGLNPLPCSSVEEWLKKMGLQTQQNMVSHKKQWRCIACKKMDITKDTCIKQIKTAQKEKNIGYFLSVGCKVGEHPFPICSLPFCPIDSVLCLTETLQLHEVPFISC